MLITLSLQRDKGRSTYVGIKFSRPICVMFVLTVLKISDSAVIKTWSDERTGTVG